jgi:hypothetical protein
MPKSRRRKKKTTTTKNTISKKYSILKSDKFIYESKFIAMKPINVGSYIINIGEVFHLKDAFIDTEKGQTGIFLGIKRTDGSIYEAGFLHPMAKSIKSKLDMDEAIYLTLVAPYIEGASHDILIS